MWRTLVCLPLAAGLAGRVDDLEAEGLMAWGVSVRHERRARSWSRAAGWARIGTLALIPVALVGVITN